jgi:imidazolonepropionase-like amidohydrolase
LKLRAKIRSGEMLGSEVFMTGPLFTAPGGHGTEYFKNFPEMVRQRLEPQMAAAYSNPAEAAARVDTLAGQGIDGIKVVLEAGGRGTLFERLDLRVFDAIADAAGKHRLPIVIHTGDLQDIRDAVARKVAGLEHGAMRDLIPPDLVQELSAMSIRYDPTLVVLDSFFKIANHDTSFLDDPLARQTISGRLIAKMRTWMQTYQPPEQVGGVDLMKTPAVENLRNLHAAGVTLVLGTDAGNAGTFHGPGVHREMEIWKNAGIPAADILKAVTLNNAQLLGAADRIGRIAPGYDASFLILDGNPLDDIAVTRRISDVFLKGERIRRSELFKQPSS